MASREFMTDVDTGCIEEYIAPSQSHSSSQPHSDPQPPIFRPPPLFQPPSSHPQDAPQPPSSQHPSQPPPSHPQSLPEPATFHHQSHSQPPDPECFPPEGNRSEDPVPPSPPTPSAQSPPSTPSRDDLGPARREPEGAVADVPGLQDLTLRDLEEDSFSAAVLISLPQQLKLEFVDGVIIHHEDDRNLAERVRSQITSLSIRGQAPKIALENEFTSGGKTEIYNFQEWFEKSTWIFLLVTRQFCQPCSHAESFKADVSLTQSCLYPMDKKDFVIPIFCVDKRYEPCVPACLRVLNGLQCNGDFGSLTDQEKKKLTRTLEKRFEERKAKEREQDKKQKEYLESNQQPRT